MIGSTGRFFDLGQPTHRVAPLTPSLRDGHLFWGHIPGNKLPGYLHLVPSGQKNSRTPVRKIEATPLRRALTPDW